MSFGVALLFPKNVLDLEPDLQTIMTQRIQEKLLGAESSIFNLNTLKIYKKTDVMIFGKFATVPDKVESILEKYIIFDLGDISASIIGKSKFKGQKEYSKLGKTIISNLANLVYQIYPYNKIGIWLYFLKGSRKIPNFEISYFDKLIVDIFLIENQMIFVENKFVLDAKQS